MGRISLYSITNTQYASNSPYGYSPYGYGYGSNRWGYAPYSYGNYRFVSIMPACYQPGGPC